jgi:hypothetical protein
VGKEPVLGRKCLYRGENRNTGAKGFNDLKIEEFKD